MVIVLLPGDNLLLTLPCAIACTFTSANCLMTGRLSRKIWWFGCMDAISKTPFLKFKWHNLSNVFKQKDFVKGSSLLNSQCSHSKGCNWKLNQSPNPAATSSPRQSLSHSSAYSVPIVYGVTTHWLEALLLCILWFLRSAVVSLGHSITDCPKKVMIWIEF